MSYISIKDLSTYGNLSSDRMRKLEAGLNDLKNQIINTEPGFSSKQTTKLKQYISSIDQFGRKLTNIRAECELKNQKLTDLLKSQERQLDGFLTSEQHIQLEQTMKMKIIEERKKLMANCEQRVRIAETIDYKSLQKIDIEERKSPANEVFRWILVAMYIEPENKYYWPNFKSQIFENAEALEDLKERLGKINALTAKQEQKVKSAKFVECWDKVKQSPQFIGFENNIQKIYEIAKIFLECCEIGKRIRDCEKKLEDSRKKQSVASEDLEQLKRQCDALNRKKKVEDMYLSQLKAIEKSISTKRSSYTKEIELAEAYSNSIESSNGGKGSLNSSSNIQRSSKQGGECILY